MLSSRQLSKLMKAASAGERMEIRSNKRMKKRPPSYLVEKPLHRRRRRPPGTIELDELIPSLSAFNRARSECPARRRGRSSHLVSLPASITTMGADATTSTRSAPRALHDVDSNPHVSCRFEWIRCLSARSTGLVIGTGRRRSRSRV